jgi:hypothetical protein
LDIAGVSYPASNEKGNLVPPRGESMMPLLAARPESVREQDEYLAWEFFDWRAAPTDTHATPEA